MVNKELLMNAFKLKILSMMSTENRVAIGVNNENQNLWNKAVLPEELKKVIDNVYKKLNEIAQENNISTESINQMIEGKRGEANIEAQSLYKKKTIEQMNKIQIELAKIKYTVDNGTIKLQEQKENIEEKTSDENNNTVIGEKLYKNIIMSIQNIQNRMNIELLERTENPIEAESKVQKIASEIIYLVKRMDIQQNIKQTLDIDDRLIASRINKELENTITDINKTDRERFIETVKVKDIPKLPTDILDDKEENQNIKENHKMYLDVNVIE